MSSNGHDRALVILQMAGGNDYLNTVVPYSNGIYYDARPSIAHNAESVLKIDDEVGFRSGLEPIKSLWDEGKVAIINGIGYPNPNRSHFRSRDIWDTALPEAVGTEGWLGRAIRDLDPRSENVLTGVNFGRGLPGPWLAGESLLPRSATWRPTASSPIWRRSLPGSSRWTFSPGCTVELRARRRSWASWARPLTMP